MAFKTRRQQRYQKLRDNGFLPFEARELSKVPAKVPYFKEIVKERRKILREAYKAKSTKKSYEEQIKDKYSKNGWIRGTKSGKRRLDPWQLMRAYEDDYKQQHPAYDSPWKKKQKGFGDFTRKMENTYRNQVGLEPPPKTFWD